MPRRAATKAEVESLHRSQEFVTQLIDRSPGKIAVSVSGGDASAVAFHRSRERWGDRVFGVFADTCSEDDDAYRLIDDCKRLIGPVVTLRQYNNEGSPMDIWDCFDHHGVMRLPKAGNACKASVELKQKPLDSFMRRMKLPFSAVGYNWTEPERMMRLIPRKPSQILVYPLLWAPRLTDCQIHRTLERIGIKPARVYQDGFVHNNCLKYGCILSGLSQFAAMKELMPESFKRTKQRADAFAARTGFTVLRDQRGGTVRPYTFAEFDNDIERGRTFGDGWQSNCSCMEHQLELFEE